jgi:hypothetical protein
MALQYLTHINLNKNELQLPVIHKLSAAPSSPAEGQIYYHDTDDTIYLYTSGGWVDLGGDITGINITAGYGLTGTVNTTNGVHTQTIDVVGGDGITANADEIEVTVDNSTIELSNTDGNGAVRIKDAGVTFAKLNGNLVITEAEGIASNDNDTTLPTSAAVKDYVDTQITAEDLDFDADSGSGAIDLDSEVFTIAGGTDIETTALTNTVTVNHSAVTRTNTTSNDLSNNDGDSFTVIDTITTSSTGHVTAVNTKTVEFPDQLTKAELATLLASYDSTDTVYIGDADNDTNLTIRGNLTVEGTTTEINHTELNIADNIITLNSDVTGTPTENAGIEVERGTEANVQFRWNEADDDWEFQAYDHNDDAAVNSGNPQLITYKVPTTYVTSIGDGTSTSYTVTHNLGSRDVTVQLYDNSSYDTVYADVVRTDTNTLTISFSSNSIPASNDIRVLVTKIG